MTSTKSEEDPTKDGIVAARAKGKRAGRMPADSEKVRAALKLVDAGLSPTAAAKQLGLGRSTVYREMSLAGTTIPTIAELVPPSRSCSVRP